MTSGIIATGRAPPSLNLIPTPPPNCLPPYYYWDQTCALLTMIMLSFQKLDVFVMLTYFDLEISVAFLCIHNNTFFCGLLVCKTSKSHVVAEEKAFWVESDISNVGGELF